jgi:hypothetical protein
MYVSRHAQARYTLRVDAETPPVPGVLKLLESAQVATPEQMDAFHVEREPNTVYLVGTHPRSGKHVLVVRDDQIITILSMDNMTIGPNRRKRKPSQQQTRRERRWNRKHDTADRA